LFCDSVRVVACLRVAAGLCLSLQPCKVCFHHRSQSTLCTFYKKKSSNQQAIGWHLVYPLRSDKAFLM